MKRGQFFDWSHLPELPCSAGIGTWNSRLPRFLWAGPSTSLDE